MTELGPAGFRLVLAGLLVALCVAHCARALRSLRGRAAAADAVVAEIAMTGAMAWLLFAAQPPRAALAALFGAAGMWFVVRAARGYVLDGTAGTRDFAGHAVCCSAMAYLLVAPSLAAVIHSGGTGMPMGGVPALTLAATGAVLVVLTGSSRRAGAALLAGARFRRGPADTTVLAAGGRWVVEALTLVMLLAAL